MTGRFALVSLVAASILLGAGCGRREIRPPAPEPPPVTSTWTDPVVAVSVDHEVLPHLGRFAVFPGDILSRRLRSRRARSMPLLYVARNLLESRGYAWSNNDQAQVIVTLDWRVTEGTKPVPPSKFWSGRVTAAHGDLAALEMDEAWGTWQRGPDPAVDTPTPEGWRTASLRVVAFDSRAGEVIWDATGHVGTDESRLGVVMPRLLEDIFARFPRSARPVARLRPGDGRLGIRLQMRTVDGVDFLPEVLDVSTGAPARKDLVPGNRIEWIEEERVRNLGLGDLFERLRGPPGSVVRFTLAGSDDPVFIERAGGR